MKLVYTLPVNAKTVDGVKEEIKWTSDRVEEYLAKPREEREDDYYWGNELSGLEYILDQMKELGDGESHVIEEPGSISTITRNGDTLKVVLRGSRGSLCQSATAPVHFAMESLYQEGIAKREELRTVALILHVSEQWNSPHKCVDYFGGDEQAMLEYQNTMKMRVLAEEKFLRTAFARLTGVNFINESAGLNNLLIDLQGHEDEWEFFAHSDVNGIEKFQDIKDVHNMTKEQAQEIVLANAGRLQFMMSGSIWNDAPYNTTVA